MAGKQDLARMERSASTTHLKGMQMQGNDVREAQKEVLPSDAAASKKQDENIMSAQSKTEKTLREVLKENADKSKRTRVK